MTTRVVVIGGGIVGASCAYQLAKEGATVTLLEKRHWGSGASGSSAAMLECQTHAYRGDTFLSIARPSLELFPKLATDISGETGIDIEYEACGILNLAMSETDAGFFRTCVEDQKKKGFHARWLTPEQVEVEFPQLEPDYFGAALFEDDGQVNGEKFLQGTLAAAKKAGADLQENLGTVRLDVSDGRVVAIAEGKRFEADSFVVAAGAWSDDVIKSLSFKTGIEPVRGQLLYYDTPPQFLKTPVFTQSHGYIVPKRSGFSLVGTTAEKVGFDETTTEEARTELARKGRTLVPGLSRKTERGVSAGLRPKSPDDYPFIGALPEHSNVFLACGHFRNGVLLAPITAELITSLVLKRKPVADVEPFSPARLRQ